MTSGSWHFDVRWMLDTNPTLFFAVFCGVEPVLFTNVRNVRFFEPLPPP